MNMMNWHPSFGPDPDKAHGEIGRAGSGDDVIDASSVDALEWRPADCCIARAAYLVVLPPVGSRVHATRLLLCGHHYRRSTQELQRAKARVYDSRGRLVTVGDRQFSTV